MRPVLPACFPVLLVLSLIAGPRATAQQLPTPSEPTAANTITANARLVILDAVVIDAKGNAVSDLSRDDFHITEDGAPEVIRDFESPGRYTPSPDVTINSTSDLDRLAPRAPVNIVLLDEFNTRFEDMAFARYSLKKWLERQPDKLTTPTMLIAVSLQNFTVLRDYTQDKNAILDALDHHFAAYPWQLHQFSWVAERYTAAFMTLNRVAEATIGHPGHKNMIWLGRGLPHINLVNVTIDGQNQVNHAIQATVNELRDARVTLYTIDPAGVMIDPGVYGQDAQDFAPFGGQPDFQALARATGGRNLYGRNDVDVEIGTSIRDGGSFYTLTYRPTIPESTEFKFRKIKITVDRPGLTVVTRQGYYPAIRPARLSNSGLPSRRLATELLNAGESNMAYDAVPFSVQAASDDPLNLKFRVEPQGLSWYFTDGTKPRYTRLIVLTTTFDKKGKELHKDARSIDFNAPASAPATGHLNLTLQFLLKIAPDPKAVRARLVVRVESTGRMGTADLDLAPGALAKSSSSQAALAGSSAAASSESHPGPAPSPTPQ